MSSPSAAQEKCVLTESRTIFALIIINKAGGLIYNRSFHDAGLEKLSTNDYLIVAGTFHG